MTAKEVKEIADNYNLESSKNGYNAIIEKIKQNARTGKYSLVIYGGIHELTVSRLRAEGYTVEYSSGDFREREPSYHTIKW